jgi:hypothetical protein
MNGQMRFYKPSMKSFNWILSRERTPLPFRLAARGVRQRGAFSPHGDIVKLGRNLPIS